MFVRANFVDFYSQGMRDRSMRSGTELAREIKLIGQWQEICLTGPLEYKYRVIFVPVLMGLDRLKGTKILFKYGEERSIGCDYTYEEKITFHKGNEWACDSDSDSTFHT